MASYFEVQKMFRELQPDVAERVRKAMPDAGDALEIVDARDDGAYWFTFSDRRIRMELTGTKQLLILVYEGDAVSPIRQMRGLIEAPQGVSEMIVLALNYAV